MCMCDDALTQEDETTHIHSGVRVDVLCVEVGGSGHVVTGVGIVIVQRHHASITYQIEFSLLVRCELVVRLYVVIVNSFL